MSESLLSWDRDDHSGVWVGWHRPPGSRRIEVGEIERPEIGQPRRWRLWTGERGEVVGLYAAMKAAGDAWRGHRGAAGE